MVPKARTHDLIVEHLPGEVLAYDLHTNKAHCLNPVAAFVWERCDGRTSFAELSAQLRDYLKVADADAALDLALEQLSSRRLLEEPVTALSESARMARRDALRKLVIALVALPVIMTVTAKKAQAQASPIAPPPLTPPPLTPPPAIP
jgi:hypothetical protein